MMASAKLYAGQIDTMGGAAGGDVRAELRALLAAQRELAEQLSRVADRIESLELATVQAGESHADSVERLVDVVRSR
jgi:hypothetical protein